MSSHRDRIFGVDFSGASRPGRSIWITEAQFQSGSLTVKRCESATKRFDLPATDSREIVYEDLRELIKENSSAVFGIDFPFGLPESVSFDRDSWSEHLNELCNEFVSGSAIDFRERCVEVASNTDRGSGYLRRETDWRYGGQCPYQHQLQYQTFHGQRDFLAPLIMAGDACVLPMQDRESELPWLVEVYPAATLSRLQLYRHGYKIHEQSGQRREWNLERLREQGVEMDDDIDDRCSQSDNAHDSLIATLGAFRALQADFLDEGLGCDLEGQIFV